MRAGFGRSEGPWAYGAGGGSRERDAFAVPDAPARGDSQAAA
eukprot:CAMPEP_0182895020 /NCGR_PEP_ID=MMETSP0034_2-20130328/25430_1 /TAXON_ID=156128 /ORGANISM="Nephroselmis pyriformis, Strain CCMP717" /LENGTH=41 /DNA_ID= /DNA_START= /DNA_END= /DNA_ORIENTATION=